MATYTVKKGDSLIDLAKKFGVSASSLLAANPGVRSINPGVTLRVPTTESYTGPAAPGSGPAFGGSPRPGVPTPQPPPYTGPAPPGSGPARGGSPRPGVPTKPAPTQPPLPPVSDFVRDVYRKGLFGALYQPTAPPLEPSRVGAPPAQPVPRADLSRYNALRRGWTPTQFSPNQFMRDFSQGFGVPTRIQGFLDRLYRRTEPVRQFFENVYGQGLGRTAAGAAAELGRTIVPPEPVRDLFRDVYQRGLGSALQTRAAGTLAPSPRYADDFFQRDAGKQAIANQLGITLEQLEVAQQQGLFPDVGIIGEQGWPVFEGQEGQHPGYPAQRTSILEWYLENGRLPIILFEEDVERMGWTRAELEAAGYIQDQYGDWIQGEMEPYAPTEAYAGGGGGGYYPYRRRGGGGYGGGRGGGGAFAYPRSFVERMQPGATPTGRTTRPARMGAVTWRI